MYKPYDITALRAEITRDEGKKHAPYRDTEGLLTIGVGWNLDANGLPDSVIEDLLTIGIDQAEEALDNIEPAWRQLDQDRQRVLLNMAFNLGQGRLTKFRKMWSAIRAAIKSGDERIFRTAAEEMRDSKWFRQVGPRAERLVARMRGER